MGEQILRYYYTLPVGADNFIPTQVQGIEVGQQNTVILTDLLPEIKPLLT